MRYEQQRIRVKGGRERRRRKQQQSIVLGILQKRIQSTGSLSSRFEEWPIQRKKIELQYEHEQQHRELGRFGR